MKLGGKVYLSKSSASPYMICQSIIGTGNNSVWYYIYEITYKPIQDMLNGINNRKF